MFYWRNYVSFFHSDALCSTFELRVNMSVIIALLFSLLVRSLCGLKWPVCSPKGASVSDLGCQ